MNHPLVRRALRAAALLIVVAAIVDPVLMRTDRSHALVAVVAATPRDSADAAQVARALAREYDIVPAALRSAAASVLVGPRNVMPDHVGPGPVFGVVPERGTPWIALDLSRIPTTIALSASTRLPVTAHAHGARPQAVTLRLMQGAVVLDQITAQLAPDQARIDTAFRVALPTVGLTTLRVEAQSAPAGSPERADVVVRVSDERSAVLFFDRRPSYQSTFVRRAVEADPRFVVAHRILTGREMSRGAGTPPTTLADETALERFDVIVVGAPDALTREDQRALERFLRRRRGAVVLLLDSIASTPVLSALTGVARWREVPGRYRADGLSEAALVAPVARLALPTRLDAAARVLATAHSATDPTVEGAAVLWATSVGAGQLYISGLLDQWRARDDASLDFARFWPAVLADAASTVVPPIAMLTARTWFPPRTPVVIPFTVRDAGAGAGRPTMVARSADGQPRDSLRVMATERSGDFIALWATPDTAATIALDIAAGAQSITVPFVISDAIAAAASDDPAARAAWLTATGGDEFSLTQLPALPAAIRRALGETPHRIPWHPMRSPWWIVPLALLLGAEWWLRRRQALP